MADGMTIVVEETPEMCMFQAGEETVNKRKLTRDSFMLNII